MNTITKTELFLRESGSPDSQAILFLHGAGLSSREWQPQMEQLADFAYCLAPDLPEHGQSLHVQPLTMEKSVEAIAHLIRDKVGKPINIVGLSMGGAIAVTLLAKYPDLVNRLMISGTAQPLSPILAWFNQLNAPLLKFMGKEQLAQMMAKQFGIPSEFREQIEDIHLLSPDALLRTSDVLKDIVVPVNASQPVLVCVGEKETFVAKNMGRQYLKSLQNAQGVLVPHVGHVWNLQNPKLFSDTVRAWFSNQALPSALMPL